MHESARKRHVPLISTDSFTHSIELDWNDIDEAQMNGFTEQACELECRGRVDRCQRSNLFSVCQNDTELYNHKLKYCRWHCC